MLLSDKHFVDDDLINFILFCSPRVTGLVNRTLLYHNGMLKLVYGPAHGQQIHTEILFQCDPEAGIGTPVLEVDTASLLLVTWNTAYACLPEAVECSTVDRNTGLLYDLSRFTAAVSR